MPDNREELKVYRLEMAKERLHSSKILLEAGSYKDSIGRSYYAMFTAVRALLAVEGQDFSKHADDLFECSDAYVRVAGSRRTSAALYDCRIHHNDAADLLDLPFGFCSAGETAEGGKKYQGRES